MFSRRSFLKAMQWAPLLYSCRSLEAFFPSPIAGVTDARNSAFALDDVRLTPHYPGKSPLDDVLRQVLPGNDEFITEKYASEITPVLNDWARNLKSAPPGLDAIAGFLSASVEATSLSQTREIKVRSANGIEVLRREFANRDVSGRDMFLAEVKTYLSGLSRIHTAEFEIVSIEELSSSPSAIRADIRYTLVGSRADGAREQRIGKWTTTWSLQPDGWNIRKWQAKDEAVSRGRGPLFVDVSEQALGKISSYREQLLRGVDHWRTVLDSASGISVYGNSGVAVGDIDNDGFDDLYVCQPAGLPNRLYRNRGDGTFDDVTDKAGVGVLDATACALFADFENKGAQDLLVVGDSGPLLFLNQGNGTFSLKRDAFQFERLPQGTFTHAAVADYDRDGRLDIYFCLYNYYVGLDQYRYPVPYFDARNGPPNFLLHNEGNATFRDRTQAAGLSAENDRYSFACAWGDHNGNGWPDLYVVNDFGRNNLYANNGDATFTVISHQAAVDDVGAGMSAAWFDFDNDGHQDIYAANMWSAAGLRLSEQKIFQSKDPENIRGLYQQHARGNSLYRNRGNGRFENVTSATGAEVGRWAWSSDAWDFDHDGWPDLYIANGYISGPDTSDLASFFWRHVVGKSPNDANPSLPYEQGWNAINELIRSDCSWAGYERNVFYWNNQNGTFSDISGIAGLDFPDDSRAFALADLDGDGRLEVVLKNRNAPQLRILLNAMPDIGRSIAFRLRGTKSNRDAIGAAVTVETGGLRQTKYLQAGSGFVSQHTKELSFGLGNNPGPVRATIVWPGGSPQVFEDIPVGHRIHVVEGETEFHSMPFRAASAAYVHPGEVRDSEPLPVCVETWLIKPLNAPDFSVPDVYGNTVELSSLGDGHTLVNFWSTSSSTCREQLRRFEQGYAGLTSQSIHVIAINVDGEQRESAVMQKSFPILLGNDEVAGVYNILYRYLYDRRRDMPLPTSFLVDSERMIIKVYQGMIHPERVSEDVKSRPMSQEARIRKALPFPGTLHNGEFGRNDFTYGVALFQRGYLDQAAASFRQVIAAKPNDPEAYYNLGTLYLRRGDAKHAREYLEKTVALRPEYPEAWNNLGMIAAQEGRADEATHDFQASLRLRPNYTIALVNLGNLHRRQGNTAEAEKLLNQALEYEPDNPEVNYSLGMLYGKREDFQRASEFLQRALSARPDYPDALNNLGVLLIREQRFSDAEEKFRACIQSAPSFDQAYLNLARLYVMQHDAQKAKAVLESLLREQPNHQAAQQMLGMLR